jgi:hypothetical protein
MQVQEARNGSADPAARRNAGRTSAHHFQIV